MPTEVEPAGAPPATRVTISAPLELQFCLFIIERAVTSSAAKWTQAWLPDFMRDHRELADAVAGFWADGAPSEWGELTVYADAAGVLFLDDVATALPRVEAVAARGLVVPPLPAEEPHVQPLIQARVDRLATSPADRERYFALLREVWAALEPSWQKWGRAAALALADQLRQQAPKLADPRLILPPNHFARRADGCGIAVSAAIDRGEMVVVPLGLAGVGYALFALPGVVIAAFGPDAEKRIEQRRQLAEAAATHFKVLSDPTRNAILGAVLQTPQSITELAEVFQLSQPTVSVHMKMLREANLVVAEKSKGQTLYRASGETVRGYVAEAVSLLVPDGC